LERRCLYNLHDLIGNRLCFGKEANLLARKQANGLRQLPFANVGGRRVHRRRGGNPLAF